MNVRRSFIVVARGPALTQVALEWAGLLAHSGARLLVRAKQRGMFRCPCSIQNMRQFVFNSSRCDLVQAT